MAASASDEKYMRRAIALSREAVDTGQMPFGALLVSGEGVVVAEATNSVIASGGDVTCHAETSLIRKARPFSPPPPLP